jgi:hypothetical protein
VLLLEHLLQEARVDPAIEREIALVQAVCFEDPSERELHARPLEHCHVTPLQILGALDRGVCGHGDFSLARGFLTGKYRPGAAVKSARAEGAGGYLDARGLRVLAALDEIAAAHGAPVAAVALAWLLTRPNVVAPIASARTPEQLAELLPVARLRLTSDEVQRLTAASDAG